MLHAALLAWLALGWCEGRRELAYAPAPIDNPLKGLVPYANPPAGRFPHSMEFDYLPLSRLVVGPGRYDWKPLEVLLDDIASRGHQTIFRVYLEYPGQPSGIPDYLKQAGLKTERYLHKDAERPSWVETPDYDDARLRDCLRRFITELGRKYDGDARIGYITAGLLGFWGEWHTYPRDDLWPSKEVQREVMDAYTSAFKKTPILLRYPAGPDDPVYASNAGLPFGYHDDSFAWATLDTGRKQDNWFFLPALRRAGALDQWKSQPIGGEIRPEAWGKVFDHDPKNPRIQDFASCVEATHATWLMDTGMFRGGASPEQYRRAVDLVGRLGYAIHVIALTVGEPTHNSIPIRLELTNRGVAPLYHDWPAELGLLDQQGRVVATAPTKGKLVGLLPGTTQTWDESVPTVGLPPGSFRLLLRVPNPLPKGNPIRFANADQDADLPGWLSLGPVHVPHP